MAKFDMTRFEAGDIALDPNRGPFKFVRHMGKFHRAAFLFEHDKDKREFLFHKEMISPEWTMKDLNLPPFNHVDFENGAVAIDSCGLERHFLSKDPLYCYSDGAFNLCPPCVEPIFSRYKEAYESWNMKE